MDGVRDTARSKVGGFGLSCLFVRIFCFPAPGRGWRQWELTLRNLKITLQMDQLSCKNPENLERKR
jgi:hypothetical protein